MGTNCAPLLADLFLFYDEDDFIQKLINDKNIKILIYRKLREQLPLLLFLTFTLHLTPDYDKRDDFNFVIIKFPHLDSIYIPTAPTNGVYISRLVRYARACSLYSDF